MNRPIPTICDRLSLRPPQRQALEILARLCELVRFDKHTDAAAALTAIQSEYPQVSDFEREFPSLCFALATGVGKTRLMGAFIAYLHLERGIDNFFVLAPNLTIYNKLIADFTPNTPKYVFRGVGEFTLEAPEIITGDNYEGGRGVRGKELFGHRIHVNIFNISKINSEVRGGKAPRIKRLQEYIGQSYFEYLAGLPDLVLLMDESHRYRGSAGVRVLNELHPILGLELTATPQIEEGKTATRFKNVIYDYPLAQAMIDGFVKEPAVATRESFRAADYTPEQLERLKLEDGIRIHEHTKGELKDYAGQSDQPLVKPFMLIVAKDTVHANNIVATIKNDDFFQGAYKEKVITVHSNQRGEEKDETVTQLLSVEQADNQTEIVVHVNMLKEGWDVTNLYTIVPLRAADSRTLVEQSIGRGLRLPYGQRVGVEAVDRLTIVAHDRFRDIIEEARRPGSTLQLKEVFVDTLPQPKETRMVEPTLMTELRQPPTSQTPSPFTPSEQPLVQAALQIIKDYGSDVRRVPSSRALTNPLIRQEIAARVAATMAPVQPLLPGVEQGPDIADVVARVAKWYGERTIDIPRIVVVPTGEVTTGYHDFDLQGLNVGYQPVAQEILIQHLRDGERHLLAAASTAVDEARLEDYLVRNLIDFDDIDYESQADLLYKLAGQMVRHLYAKLHEEESVRNVLLFYERPLAQLIHRQMHAHRWERATGYQAQVSKGFEALQPVLFASLEGTPVYDFRRLVARRQDIPNLVFGGFSRCLYPVQKFSSDPEREFAVLLEREAEDLQIKWFKPARGQFKIFYSNEEAYEPDFVVETATHKYLCEPKRADQMTSAEVLAKGRAAVQWCRHASEHELAHGGKAWSYLLIPHDAIDVSATLKSLVARYTYTVAESAALQPLVSGSR